MPYLKHPDSDRVIRVPRGEHFDVLLNKGYNEVARYGQPLKKLYRSYHGQYYPVKRPKEDLEKFLQYCPQVTEYEAAMIRSVIVILEQKLVDQVTLVR